MTVSVTTTGLRKLQSKALRRAAFLASGGMKDLVLEPMAKDMVVEMRRTLTGFVPGQVPDLKASYRRMKQRKFGHAYPILHATGQLLQSMYSQVIRRGDVWVLQIGFRGSRGKTSNAAIAAAHIEGKGVPKRDFTVIRKGWERQWLKRISTLLRAIQ